MLLPRQLDPRHDMADGFIDRVVAARFHNALLELEADNWLDVAQQVDDAKRVEMCRRGVLVRSRGRQHDAVHRGSRLHRVQECIPKLCFDGGCRKSECATRFRYRGDCHWKTSSVNRRHKSSIMSEFT